MEQTQPRTNSTSTNPKEIVVEEKKIKKKSFTKMQGDKMAALHKEGKLGDFFKNLADQMGAYISFLLLLLTLPAMPIIFYLTMLYNVILLTWRKFKNIDTYNKK